MLKEECFINIIHILYSSSIARLMHVVTLI